MRLKKITLSDIVTIVLTLTTAALIFSTRARAWAMVGLMSLGFYNPKIPVLKPGEKLMPAPAVIVQTLDGKVVDRLEEECKVVCCS